MSTIEEQIKEYRDRLYKKDGSLKSNASSADLAKLEELEAIAAGDQVAQDEQAAADEAKTENPTAAPDSGAGVAIAAGNAEREELLSRLAQIEASLETIVRALKVKGLIRKTDFRKILKIQ